MRATVLALTLLTAACASAPRVQADPPFNLDAYDTFR